MTSGGWVYAIGGADENARARRPIKIGITRDLDRRLRQLQAGSPRSLSVLSAWFIPTRGFFSARIVEYALHTRFRARHSHGEWFFISLHDVIKGIDAVAIEYGYGVGPSQDGKSFFCLPEPPRRKSIRNAAVGWAYVAEDEAPKQRKRTGRKPMPPGERISALFAKRDRNSPVDRMIATLTGTCPAQASGIEPELVDWE